MEVATAEIIGLTPLGRATVACLQMNTAVQMAARRQWMRLGLFPPAWSTPAARRCAAAAEKDACRPVGEPVRS